MNNLELFALSVLGIMFGTEDGEEKEWGAETHDAIRDAAVKQGILNDENEFVKPEHAALTLEWQRVTTVEDFLEEGAWLFEAPYKGIRVACGFGEGGPQVWIGHPTKDLWAGCSGVDGSFEGEAVHAVAFAEEAMDTGTEIWEVIGIPNPKRA